MNLSHKKIVIIAGEESGDFHSAQMIQQLKSTHPHLEISGIGGRHLQKAGVSIITDLTAVSSTGVTALFQHLMTILKAFVQIKRHLRNTKPDLLILVDYPEFNLRLLKYAKQFGIKILYYISPQIWAWKPNRVHHIRRYVDHMAVILPFEKAIYQQADVSVSYVGHPLARTITARRDPMHWRQQLALPVNKRIIALLPGSRRNEIEYHLPILIQTIVILTKKYPDIHFIIPCANHRLRSSIDKQLQTYPPLPLTLIDSKARECMASSDCVVVASGTASLECALLQIPMCIIYKSSTFNYFLARKLLRINYLGLCNILQNTMIVPELLQHDCNAVELSKMVIQLLEDNNFKKRMLAKLASLAEQLSEANVDDTLDDIVKKIIT